MNQAAQAVPSLDAGGGRDSTRVGLVADSPRWPKLKASVRPLVVVVPQVLVEDPLKMASPPDQQPVQAFLSHRPHPALGVGVAQPIPPPTAVPEEPKTASARGRSLPPL
jgi:hypothetical protein